MMPHYKLTYFNFRARAETSRFLFALAGVDYEDFRVERSEYDGSDLKARSPFGQLPLLEVDGKVLCQSRAIERYLARKFDLAGKSEWDHARVDMIVECMEDYMRPAADIFREKDESRKKEMIKKYVDEQAPLFLDNLQKLVKENDGGKHSCFVGKDITLADVSFYNMSKVAAGIVGQTLPASWDRWPALKAVCDKVEGHVRVKAWIAKRPVTQI